MKIFLLTFLALVAVTWSEPRVGFGPGYQDWGYTTVRPGAHIFHWLYYTTAQVARYTERPLIIYLQGGPGGSSVGFGNFIEMGLLDVEQKPRKKSWVHNYNVMFIDSPVGTGFSIIESPELLTTTNKEVAADMLEFLKQFYARNPEFESVPLHIYGESYGGKMITDIALFIHEAVKAGELNVKLESIGLGDSWISTEDHAMATAPFMYQTGFVDEDGYNRVRGQALYLKYFTEKEQWPLANEAYGLLFNRILTMTGGIDVYNIVAPIKYEGAQKKVGKRDFRLPAFAEDMEKLEILMNGPVKKVLGTNKTWIGLNDDVFYAQGPDFMKPVRHLVAQILDETDIKVVVYNGQLDLIVAVSGTVNWVNNLEWSGREAYLAEERHPLVVDGIVEGYYKSHKNLYMYWVDRAGHMAPQDNPNALGAILKETAGF